MSGDEGKHKPWGKWLAFVAIGLITISLISFSNSMDDIEDLVDPGQNNSGIIGPNSNKEILLEDNRIYTILRIVENINDEAELDLEITNSDDKIMNIDEPTWMQPQRTGEGGSVIYDPVGTISLTQSGEFNFKNSNSTSTIYVVDDQSVDLQAFQQPGILIAFVSCCFGLIILPLSLIVHLLVGRKKVEQRVVMQKMPTDRIPTTDELFLIRERKLDPQNIQGIKPKKSIPPPFTNMSEIRKHVPAYKTQPDFGDDEDLNQRIKVTKNTSNDETEKQNDTKVDEDWQTWDSG